MKNLLTKCQNDKNLGCFVRIFAAALGFLERFSRFLFLKLPIWTDYSKSMPAGWIEIHTFASGVQNMGERVCP